MPERFLPVRQFSVDLRRLFDCLGQDDLKKRQIDDLKKFLRNQRRHDNATHQRRLISSSIKRPDKRKRQGHPLSRMACRILLFSSRAGRAVHSRGRATLTVQSYGSLGCRPLRYFAASRVNLWICGGSENSSSAFSISAAATLPSRWACRSSSESNVSKIAYAPGPYWIAYQVRVPGSA